MPGGGHLPDQAAPGAGYVASTDASGRLHNWVLISTAAVPACADGSLIVSDGVVYNCIAIGAENQILQVIGGQPTWQNNPGFPACVAEDILVFDGANFVCLNIGNENDILTVVGGTPTWAAPPASSIPAGTIIGQVLHWDGNNWIVLDPGTPGQKLQTNGGGLAPTWVDVATTVRGSESLSTNDTEVTVVFPALPALTYTITASLLNTWDNPPTTLTWIITDKLLTGFTAEFSGQVPNDNYSFEWLVSYIA